MYKFIFIIFLITSLTCNNARAEDFTLNGFQRADGSITLFFGDNFVDPYFATKSLIMAGDESEKLNKITDSWIEWAIKRQNADGLFGRYKLNSSGGWETVAKSDADDSTLALWLRLLYSRQYLHNMHENWKESIKKSENQLDLLWNEKLQIYHISESIPVGLLMDNSEIYDAFLTIADRLEEQKLWKKASAYRKKAEKLREGIIAVFGSDKNGLFRVSTQIENGNKFYPDKAAQLFPIMYQLQENAQAESLYKKWIKENKTEWLEQHNQDYPWGLFAVLAVQMNDLASASCWRNRAAPMRYGKHWNILEEVSLNIVERHIDLAPKANDLPCKIF